MEQPDLTYIELTSATKILMLGGFLSGIFKTAANDVFGSAIIPSHGGRQFFNRYANV